MKTGISLVLSVTFILLALLHFYWAMKGTWAFKQSLPTTVEGKRILNSSTIDCAVVGFFLALFGGYYLVASGWLLLDLPLWFLAMLRWLIPSVFLLRALGDWKYVGFFKKVVGTEFSRLDSLIFSPLCLVIAILGFLVMKWE